MSIHVYIIIMMIIITITIIIKEKKTINFKGRMWEGLEDGNLWGLQERKGRRKLIEFFFK